MKSKKAKTANKITRRISNLSCSFHSSSSQKKYIKKNSKIYFKSFNALNKKKWSDAKGFEHSLPNISFTNKVGYNHDRIDGKMNAGNSPNFL